MDVLFASIFWKTIINGGKAIAAMTIPNQ